MLKISSLSKESKKGVSYDYSSVQFDLPKTLAEKVISWGRKNIPDSDLYVEEKKFGRENEIHVTVKYGLHTTDIRKVEKKLEGVKPFSISLGKVSRFVPSDGDFDVVKLEVDGDELSDIHKKIGELPNSDEHPIYRAHCTVAYVKKGRCRELSGNTDLKGETAKVNELVFSSKDGGKEKIRL